MSKKRDRFTDAYFNYYTIVYNAVYLKVSNIDDAEDICQEVFIRFYNKIDEVENTRKWLYGTLKMVVLEYYKKKTTGNVNIDDVFNDIALTFVNGMRDTRLIISSAIESISNTLTEDELKVFELIAYYNYTYNETAKNLGMTLRMVEYRYNKIVTQIIDHLKKKGIKDINELL